LSDATDGPVAVVGAPPPRLDRLLDDRPPVVQIGHVSH
jgi:hypothetical protein